MSVGIDLNKVREILCLLASIRFCRGLHEPESLDLFYIYGHVDLWQKNGSPTRTPSDTEYNLILGWVLVTREDKKRKLNMSRT